MSECEDFIKENLEMVDGLAEMIAKSQEVQVVWGVKVRLFQPVKLVVGSQYIIGVVVRVTKETIAVLDAVGNINAIRISKLNMISTITCEDFKRHRELYRIKLQKRQKK